MTRKININLPPIDIETISLGTDINSVQKKLNMWMYAKGINCLLFPPGTGKTYTLNRILEKEESFFVAIPTHNLGDSEYNIKRSKKWEGFTRSCIKIKDNDPFITKLSNCNVSKSQICKTYCDNKECNYKKQWNNKKVIAPFHYLNTQYVYKKGSFKFDLLVIDEDMKGNNDIEFNEASVIEAIKTLNKYQPIPNFKEVLLEIIKLKDMFLFNESLETITYQKRKALNKAIASKKWKDVKIINQLDIYNIRKYFYYYHIYKEDKSYSEPYIYTIFDLARQGVPIILSDASFSKKLFKTLLEMYRTEEKKLSRKYLLGNDLKSIEEIPIKMFESEIENKNFDIYNMWNGNYFYKASFEFEDKKDYYLKSLKTYIKTVLRKYVNVGIIVANKSFENEFSTFGKTAHYGNLRGLNEFKDMDAIFLIGTYTPNHKSKINKTTKNKTKGIIEQYNNLFLTSYTNHNTWKPTYEGKGPYTQKGTIHEGIKEYTETFIIDVPIEFKQPEGRREVPYYHYPQLKNRYKELADTSIKNYGNLLYLHEFKNGIHIPTDKISTRYLHKLEYNYQKRMGEIDAKFKYPLENYDNSMRDTETYQAIHRARPFIKRGPNKEDIKVFIFGYVPQQIKDEFNVIELNKEETDCYFNENFIGTDPLPLFNRIHKILMEFPNSDKKNIANRVGVLTETGNVNTKIITAVDEGFISHKSSAKIHECIRNGEINPSKSIKDLKILEEDIDRFTELYNFFVSYSKGLNLRPWYGISF